jgi:hypothetical protein
LSFVLVGFFDVRCADVHLGIIRRLTTDLLRGRRRFES